MLSTSMFSVGITEISYAVFENSELFTRDGSVLFTVKEDNVLDQVFYLEDTVLSVTDRFGMIKFMINKVEEMLKQNINLYYGYVIQKTAFSITPYININRFCQKVLADESENLADEYLLRGE